MSQHFWADIAVRSLRYAIDVDSIAIKRQMNYNKTPSQAISRYNKYLIGKTSKQIYYAKRMHRSTTSSGTANNLLVCYFPTPWISLDYYTNCLSLIRTHTHSHAHTRPPLIQSARNSGLNIFNRIFSHATHIFTYWLSRAAHSQIRIQYN